MSMKASSESAHCSDYAVAMVLNQSVNSIFSIISLYQFIGPQKEFNPEELNRLYILLVNELDILYIRNPKLAKIEPEPTWKKFDIIKGRFYEIRKYLEKNDSSHDHILRVEKLCILSEQEIPKLSPKQKKYIDETKKMSDKYFGILKDALEKIPEDTTQEEIEKNPRNRRFWCIQEYTIKYKPDGTILINNVLKLKKAHAGSTIERLLEQSIKNSGALYKPAIGQTSRNLSTVLSSAGFTPTLREIFFPIVSDDKGIIFRQKVTRNQILEDRIDTYELDTTLYKAGAEIAVRPGEELVALGIAAPDEED